jgi:hypothetical protein
MVGILAASAPRGLMCDVEEQIENLGPEIAKIYFNAKGVLVEEPDSSSERFATAARIVRAFWKRMRRPG